MSPRGPHAPPKFPQPRHPHGRKPAPMPPENPTPPATIPTETWPALPQSAWSDTCATLQLWTQIIGKIRRTLVPHLNHSWNVTLYPTVRGLTTLPMAHGHSMLQIDFDFLSHQLLIDVSDGSRR